MIKIDESSDLSNDFFNVNEEHDEIMKFMIIIIDHNHFDISKINLDEKIHL